MQHCGDEVAAEDSMAGCGSGNSSLAGERLKTWDVRLMVSLVAR